MSIGSRTKDPADVRTYSIDWSAWLTSINNDTISTSAWVLPNALTLQSSSNTTTKTNGRISGGVAGTSYVIQNTVVTAAGETKRVSFTLVVQNQ